MAIPQPTHICLFAHTHNKKKNARQKAEKKKSNDYEVT